MSSISSKKDTNPGLAQEEVARIRANVDKNDFEEMVDTVRAMRCWSPEEEAKAIIRMIGEAREQAISRLSLEFPFLQLDKRG